MFVAEGGLVQPLIQQLESRQQQPEALIINIHSPARHGTHREMVTNIRPTVASCCELLHGVPPSGQQK